MQDNGDGGLQQDLVCYCTHLSLSTAASIQVGAAPGHQQQLSAPHRPASRPGWRHWQWLCAAWPHCLPPLPSHEDVGPASICSDAAARLRCAPCVGLPPAWGTVSEGECTQEWLGPASRAGSSATSSSMQHKHSFETSRMCMSLSSACTFCGDEHTHSHFPQCVRCSKAQRTWHTACHVANISPARRLACCRFSVLAQWAVCALLCWCLTLLLSLHHGDMLTETQVYPVHRRSM